MLYSLDFCVTCIAKTFCDVWTSPLCDLEALLDTTVDSSGLSSDRCPLDFSPLSSRSYNIQ